MEKITIKIGIDIDDVITDTFITMKRYIDKYDDNSDIHSHIEEVMRGEMPTQGIKNFFTENIINIMKSAKIKKDASEVIQELLNEGNQIFIITARGEMKFKGSEQVTLQYLKLHNINYTKILFNSFEKSTICKDYNIDVMIDDSIKYCLEIEKENMKSILFTSVVNKSSNTTVKRVNNWKELKNEIDIILRTEQ